MASLRYPGSPPTIRREYRRGHRGREEGPRKAIQAQLPPDVKIEIIEDQSGFIYAALHEINMHLIVGSILASLVVFLFMRNWRAMVIAAVAIPSSLIAAFGVMWALHFTLNSVTMLALVLMVGIVIDDALVVLENTFRFLEEKRMPPFEAARAATADIGHAVLATTLSLVVIFVPVSFMSSICGSVPLPIWNHGRSGRDGQPARFVYADADDVLAHAARGHGAVATMREVASGFLSLDRRVYMATLRLSMRHRVAVALAGCRGHRLHRFRCTGSSGRIIFPTNVDDGAFEVR